MKTKYILTREEVAEIAYQGLPRLIKDVKGTWTFRGLSFEFTFTKEEVEKALLRHLEISLGSYDVAFYGLEGYTAEVEVTVTEKEETPNAD